MEKEKKKKLLASIDKKAAAVIKNQKNANKLIELLKFTNSNKSYVKKASIEALTRLFETLLTKKKLVLLNENELKNLEDTTNPKVNAEDKYRIWLFKRFIDFKEVLVNELEETEATASELIKLTCLKSAFDLIKSESTLTSKVNQSENAEIKFPYEFFNSVLKAIIKSELSDKVLKKLGFYLNFADLRFFCLRYILTDFFIKNKVNESIMTNILNLFIIMPELVKDQKSAVNSEKADKEEIERKMIETELTEKELNELMTKEAAEPEKADLIKTGKKYSNFFALNPENLSSKSKVCLQDVHRKFFNDCVVNLLKNQLSIKFYKKFLIKLPEKILPKMSNPLMLSDFLTQSYNSGGLISVLALNSLFVLITSFNLEYPNFYQKVYQLLDASIFSTKYKDRFFQHLDSFLLSTHLSATLVGAFIKKLSRMLLTCPPGDARFLILFIYNLLIRHKNCKVLIHRFSKKKEANEITSDPFDVNCTDYTKCNALKSSLWEIMSLRNHYLSHVSKEVNKLYNLSQSEEYPLDDAFENNSFEEIILNELDSSKGTSNCAINFHFQNNEDADLIVYDSNVSNLLKYN